MAYDELTAKLVSENATLHATNERLLAALNTIANCEPRELGEWVIILARAVIAQEKQG